MRSVLVSPLALKEIDSERAVAEGLLPPPPPLLPPLLLPPALSPPDELEDDGLSSLPH
jgi:hypothetical protein